MTAGFAELRRANGAAARIDPAVIDTVDWFFNGDGILHEMLHDARRAGATRVDIVRTGEALPISDDERRLGDPDTRSFSVAAAVRRRRRAPRIRQARSALIGVAVVDDRELHGRP